MNRFPEPCYCGALDCPACYPIQNRREEPKDCDPDDEQMTEYRRRYKCASNTL